RWPKDCCYNKGPQSAGLPTRWVVKMVIFRTTLAFALFVFILGVATALQATPVNAPSQVDERCIILLADLERAKLALEEELINGRTDEAILIRVQRDLEQKERELRELYGEADAKLSNDVQE